MQAQLAQALEERDQLRSHLSNLANIADDNDVSAEQSAALKAEYEQRLGRVEQRIASLKSSVQSQINIMKSAVDAYNAQIEKLRVQAASGALAPAEFQRQVQKLSRGKERSKQQLASFQIMVKAESPTDLAGITGPRRTRVRIGGGDVHEIVLRAAGGVVGGLLLVSVFMPAASGLGGLVKVSLFQAGNLAHNLGDSKGLLLWIVPIAVALVIGLTSAISKRTVRGGVLVCIGAFILAALVVALAVATFYPMPVAGGLSGIASAVARPGLGIFCMFVALLATYVLGGANLWTSKRGREWTILTAVLLVLTGIGTSVYCMFGFNAEPELALAVAGEGSYGADMNITITNGGNLAMMLSDTLSKKAERNEFALKVQRRGKDGTWTDVATGLEMAGSILGPGQTTIPPGESNTFKYPAGFARGEQVAAMRAVLVNNSGEVVTSDPVEVTRSAQLQQRPSSSLTPTPAITENPAVAEAQRKVDTLEAQGSTVSRDRFAQSVAEVRAAIDRVDDVSERNGLHKRVDNAIRSAKDGQTRQMYVQAYEYYNKGFYEQALDSCNAIIDICSEPPVPMVMRQAPNSLSQARTLISHIEMMLDPHKRYSVRGVIMRDGSASAMVYDNHSRRSRTVGVGDKLDEYKVEAIDDKQGVVALRKGGETFKLMRQ